MSTEFLMKPKIDFAFKEIMMNENARLGFLSAILHIAPENIRETRILNTYLRKQHQDDKQGILDVRILLNDDTEIDIEVQIAEIKVWAERSLFYLAKMYAEQIKPGENYNNFKKCVSISILDFTLFENDPDFYSCFHIREDTRHTLFTDKMEFHVIELSKLPATLQERGNSILYGQNLSTRSGRRNLKCWQRKVRILTAPGNNCRSSVRINRSVWSIRRVSRHSWIITRRYGKRKNAVLRKVSSKINAQ